MKIVLVHRERLPVSNYDDAGRMVWWLASGFAAEGHTVVLIARKGSKCAFAKVIEVDDKVPVFDLIPTDADIVHFHGKVPEYVDKPYLVTYHGNLTMPGVFDRNTVFLSANHAERHGGLVFVHPGLDISAYGKPVLDARRLYYHFTGNSGWIGKNIRGAIDMATRLGVRLHVIGGNRVNFRRGLRITLSPNVRFHGILSGEGRDVLLNSSRGLFFPAIWHEPFGLSILESLFFGCPVFGTPYGSLPEIMLKGLGDNRGKRSGGTIEALYSEFGYLATSQSELIGCIRGAEGFSASRCHAFVCDNFSHFAMCQSYMELYEKVIKGVYLHDTAPSVLLPTEDKTLPFLE